MPWCDCFYIFCANFSKKYNNLDWFGLVCIVCVFVCVWFDEKMDTKIIPNNNVFAFIISRLRLAMQSSWIANNFEYRVDLDEQIFIFLIQSIEQEQRAFICLTICHNKTISYKNPYIGHMLKCQVCMYCVPPHIIYRNTAYRLFIKCFISWLQNSALFQSVSFRHVDMFMVFSFHHNISHFYF